jgi:hypothetical protein
MNIFFELGRYIIIVIIGIILIIWYERKKGWENKFGTSLLFILCWRTLMFIILITINFIQDRAFLNVYELSVIYPIILIIVSFFINIFLGVYIFRLVYNQKMQESIVIILIIVIVEMILESILLYVLLIPETLISNFNL